jgi:hypothetical protein
MVDPRTLYLVISGAPAREGVADLVKRLQSAWRVSILSTHMGTRFHDVAELAELTGAPVRSEFRMPGTGSPLPPADAVLACPLTFASVNKFAAGIADNFAVSLLCEMAGHGVPTVVVPACKPALARHPAFVRSLATLRSIPAVTVLHDTDASHDRQIPSWHTAIETVHAVTRG